MWRFLVKNFMLDLTCLQAHVHTMDVFVYSFFFLGIIFSESLLKKIVFMINGDMLLDHLIYIYIYMYVLP